MGCAEKSLPFQGRWTGGAGTERSWQICDNLSVTFGDSVPTPFVPSGHFPLIGGIDMLSSEVQHLKKKKDNTHSKV